ncbi:MAG: (2Fe-2S) ferredoxin domain-containing protein [Clostridia bacterium]|nr:(2Fe-2S) ferredoxin domain-containing protein [Clostridia bacterium]
MKVTICVGSTCHLMGSKTVVERFQQLVEQHHLEDRVELSGKFCMGKCGEGVSVTVDGVHHAVAPSDAESFFEREILAKV